jgi:ribonuclease HI
LATIHVGVDGSFKEQHGIKRAAGAVCYFTSGGEHPGHTEARIITCTFDGEQTSAHAEMSSMSLALQTLGREAELCISWDLKHGMDTMHSTLDLTRPGAEEQTQPPAAGLQGDCGDAAAVAHYAHNPHMQRALALAA